MHYIMYSACSARASCHIYCFECVLNVLLICACFFLHSKIRRLENLFYMELYLIDRSFIKLVKRVQKQCCHVYGERCQSMDT